MSDNITNGEILRAINKLDKQIDELKARFDKMESKIDNFKSWVFNVVISIILGAGFTVIGSFL